MRISTHRAARAILHLVLVAALGGATAAGAATITVNSADDERNNDGDCALREAVLAANMDVAVDGCTAGSGADTIVFADGVMAPTVVLGQMGFLITSDVTVDGDLLAGRITIDGSLLYRIFDVQDGGALTLTNLDLTRARAERGAAVLVRAGGTLAVASVGFDGNEATGAEATDGGGAIYAFGTITSLDDAMFSNNVASGAAGSGGALFLNGADASLSNASFTSNTSNRAGGAIENRDGALTIVDSDFTTNDAGMSPGNGGAIHLSAAGTADVTGGAVSGNTAVEGGGFWNSGATMTVRGTAFSGNVASGDGTPDRVQGGGALFNNGGQLAVIDVTATGNSATGSSGSGGAILNGGGSLWVMTSTVSNNTARCAGGGIEDAGGTAVLVMSTLDGNSVVADANPGNGGAVHSGGGTLVVAGGTVSNNAAVEGGGLWTSGSMVVTADERDIPDAMRPDVVFPTITPAVITMNEATGGDADQGGGGLYATPSGEILITDAEVSDNVASGASGSGGGIFSAGTLTSVGTTISGNTANRAGGGIEDAGGMVILTDVMLTGNAIGTPMPGNGGGLHSGGGNVTIVRGMISGNTAVEGGGLWSNGMLTLNGGADGDREEDAMAADGDRSAFTTVSGNEATGADAGIGGGGIYVESGGMASLRYAIVDGNAASGAAGSGGGLFLADGATTMASFSEITNNTANRAGGGIELFDDPMTDTETRVWLRQVLVGENAIDVGAPGNGGGLHAGGAGVVEVRMSTFAGNDAVEGGGLWINAAGSLRMDNSTVTGNTAQNDGGGVYDNDGADVMLSSVTVASNEAGGDGGGLYSASDDMYVLRNTISGDNVAGGTGVDCFGTIQSGGTNMLENTAGCSVTGETRTDILGADPALAPLAANGGFTPTRAITVSSRAIDTGDSAFDVDQRGFQRTYTPDDRGAFEYEGAAVATGDEPGAGVFGLDAPQPNPTTGRARVSFTVAEAAPVELAVFNVLGQRVLTAFEGPASPGATETVELDVRGLAAGVYVLRLQSGSAMETRQLTVVR